MYGPDRSLPQPESISQAILRPKTSLQRRGDQDSHNTQESDLQLEVFGGREVAHNTPISALCDGIVFPIRKAQHLSELSVISRFWHSHVHLSVEHKACRDHLGKS